jgi:hypothetical protein
VGDSNGLFRGADVGCKAGKGECGSKRRREAVRREERRTIKRGWRRIKSIVAFVAVVSGDARPAVCEAVGICT